MKYIAVLLSLLFFTSVTFASLPSQTQTRISVDKEGVFSLTFDDVAVEGEYRLSSNGEDVAYHIEGDGDEVFEAGETMLFYGQSFQGSRFQKQYIDKNVYLFELGTSSIVSSSTSAASGSEVVTTTIQSVDLEPENVFFTLKTDDWSNYPNEADSWYWQKLIKFPFGPRGFVYELPTKNPASAVDVEIEMSGGLNVTHNLELSVNGTLLASPSFSGEVNANLSMTIPLSVTSTSGDEIEIKMVSGGSDTLYLNRISATYEQLAIAESNFYSGLVVMPADGVFAVSGFDADVEVWDVTNSTYPERLQVDRVNDTYEVNLQAGSYNLVFASVESVNDVSTVSVEPLSTESVNWLAVTHSDFVTATMRLASHRDSEMTTRVVTWDAMVDEYGYGFNSPDALKNYLSAFADAPEYVLLVGDATINPRQIPCVFSSCDDEETDFLPTNLLYVDRFNGLSPSDYPYTLLDGDEVPDFAIGRLAAQTLVDADNMVDKIIKYEADLASGDITPFNVQFAADNVDSGGNFCYLNELTMNRFDAAGYSTSTVCMDNASSAEKDKLNTTVTQAVNNGVGMLVYRGHGSVNSWASGAYGTSDLASWENVDNPMVVVSADCLDGNFTYGSPQALSESAMRLSGSGSAAWWSSSGLGFYGEYSKMTDGFYDTILSSSDARIGDAVRVGKTGYAIDTRYDRSLLYTFILQGDPAMSVASNEIPPTAVSLSALETKSYSNLLIVLVVLAVVTTYIMVVNNEKVLVSFNADSNGNPSDGGARSNPRSRRCSNTDRGDCNTS